MPDELSSDDHELLARIAHRSYVDGRTQEEIAVEFGMSRPKVQRLLERARSSGVVEIHIAAPPELHLDLESRLVETFGLADAIVSPHRADPQDQRGGGRPERRPLPRASPRGRRRGRGEPRPYRWRGAAGSSARTGASTACSPARWAGRPWSTPRPTRTRSAARWPTAAVAARRACTHRSTSTTPRCAICCSRRSRCAPTLDARRRRDVRAGRHRRHRRRLHDGAQRLPRRPTRSPTCGSRGAVGDILGSYVDVDGPPDRRRRTATV